MGLSERLAEGPVDLRRGLPVRARAARLRPGRAVRPGGRARGARGGRGAPSRVRRRRLRRRRGLHLLRPPREAARDRPRGRPRARSTVTALRIASGVAAETGALRRRQHQQHARLRPRRPGHPHACRAMFDEQIGWAVDAGVDFVIAETFPFCGEATARRRGGHRGRARLRRDARDLPRSGARSTASRSSRRAGGSRPPAPPSPGSTACAARHDAAAARPARRGRSTSRSRRCRCPTGRPRRRPRSCRSATPATTPARRPRVPDGARPARLQPLRGRRLHPRRRRARGSLPRPLLRRRPASHPRDGRGARTHAAGEPLLRRTWSATPCSATRRADRRTGTP